MKSAALLLTALFIFSPALHAAETLAAPAPAGLVAQWKQNFLRFVWEFQAIREIAAINNASVRYYQKREFFPRLIRQLTLDGLLPVHYEKGEIGKYRFYFTNISREPDDLAIHADPLDPALGLRAFYVGPDAVMRVSDKAPADQNSPKHSFFSRPPAKTV